VGSRPQQAQGLQAKMGMIDAVGERGSPGQGLTQLLGTLTEAVGDIEKILENAPKAPTQCDLLWKESQRITEVGTLAFLNEQDVPQSVTGGEGEPEEPKATAEGTEARIKSLFEQVGQAQGRLESVQGAFNVVRAKLAHMRDELKSSNLVQGIAHVPNESLHALSHEELRQHWCCRNTILPEFRTAHGLLCLRHEWMSSTMVTGHLAEICRRREDLEVLTAEAQFDRVLADLIKKAYELPEGQDPRQQKDALSDQTVWNAVHEVSRLLVPGGSQVFGVGMKIMLEEEDDNGALVATLSEVTEHSHQCDEVKVKAFWVLMSHSARLLQRRRLREGLATLEDLDSALAHFYTCFTNYLDEHKERAFCASFLEPALFYWSHTEEHHVHNTAARAVNWHLALLNAALGTQLPRQAHYTDNQSESTVDFWLALKDECWQQFASPDNFGKSWRSIPELKNGGRALLRMKVRQNQWPHSRHCSQVREWANNAVAPEGDAGVRRALSLYLERFAHFFTREFFVRRAFEALYSETKPEHAGFRKACATLFRAYRNKHEGITEEGLADHLFPKDPNSLDVERTVRFLVWLKVLKSPQPGDDCDDERHNSTRPRFSVADMEASRTRLIGMNFDAAKVDSVLHECLGSAEAAASVLMGFGVPPYGLPKGQLEGGVPWPSQHLQHHNHQHGLGHHMAFGGHHFGGHHFGGHHFGIPFRIDPWGQHR